MKIKVGFRDKVVGTGESNGADIRWEPPALEGIAASYARDGYRADALLRKMVEDMKGNWWAVEEKPK